VTVVPSLPCPDFQRSLPNSRRIGHRFGASWPFPWIERPNGCSTESVKTTWGARLQPRWLSHPLCTRSRIQPKPAPRTNVGEAPVHPKASSRSHHLARVAERDPKITPGTSGEAGARAPRRSEDRGGGQHHTEVDGPSSRAPGRLVHGGERPAVRPKPFRIPSAHRQLVLPDERPASPGHRVTPAHPPVRAEARTRGSWSGLPVCQPLPEGDGRGQDSRKTRFLVAGFHTRFVPPPSFSRP
jgi:hypothetical protein